MNNLRRRVLIVFVTLMLLVASVAIYFTRRAVASSCPTTSVNTGRPVDPDLIAGNNRFALDLYRKIAGAQEGNFVYSPYSISQAVAMVYLGADGDTKSQIENTLHFTGSPEDTHAGLETLNNTL